MKKGFVALLCLFVIASLYAQDYKLSKKERKEVLKTAIPACVTMIEGGEVDPVLAQAIEAEGYCTCMMDNLFKKYSYSELVGMFTKKSKTDMVLAFYEDPNNQTKTMQCMRENMKDEAAMKKVILGNAFGMETCVAGIEKENIGIELNAEGYCLCMFEKMDQNFTVKELLDENTYNSEKLQVYALECVLANVADVEEDTTK